MKTLKSELKRITQSLETESEEARIARRTAEVQSMFKEAIEHVYKSKAGYVLDHVNAVYIKRETRAGSQAKEYKALYVYMDDSNFRSDVYNQQHFILLKLKELYGEEIEVFKTFPSRMGMKERHPYRESAQEMIEQAHRVRSVPLDKKEITETMDQGDFIENEQLRRAFLRAAIINKEWKKGEQEFL